MHFFNMMFMNFVLQTGPCRFSFYPEAFLTSFYCWDVLIQSTVLLLVPIVTFLSELDLIW